MRVSGTILVLTALLVCSHLQGQDSLESDDVTILFPPGRRQQAEATLALYRRAQKQVSSVTGLPHPARVTIELAKVAPNLHRG